jgi:hypothetical protein
VVVQASSQRPDLGGYCLYLQGLAALAQSVERLTRNEKFPSRAHLTTHPFSPTACGVVRCGGGGFSR